MNSFNSLKKFGLAVVAMTLMLTAANAQQRYKHVPRVKIKKHEVAVVESEQTNTTTTSQMMVAEEKSTPVVNETVSTVSETAPVVASTENNVIAETKTKSVVHHNKVEKVNKRASKESFTNKVKDNSKLMDVKDAKKSNMERWVLIMIILLAAALIFTILALIFLFATYIYALYLVFIIIAGLCWIGAGVVLLLGLLGVI